MWEDESHSLTEEAALYSAVTAADTCVSFARRQQGEQAVAGLGVVLTSLISQMGTNDVLGGFNHPLQSLPVLGRAYPSLICVPPVRMLGTGIFALLRFSL